MQSYQEKRQYQNYLRKSEAQTASGLIAGNKVIWNMN